MRGHESDDQKHHFHLFFLGFSIFWNFSKTNIFFRKIDAPPFGGWRIFRFSENGQKMTKHGENISKKMMDLINFVNIFGLHFCGLLWAYQFLAPKWCDALANGGRSVEAGWWMLIIATWMQTLDYQEQNVRTNWKRGSGFGENAFLSLGVAGHLI